MSNEGYTVRAEWDEEARVWVASSDDVPGLATEAPTMEGLLAKLRTMVPEMLEENGVLPPNSTAELPVNITAHRLERIRSAA